jgi:hypothetical protein
MQPNSVLVLHTKCGPKRLHFKNCIFQMHIERLLMYRCLLFHSNKMQTCFSVIHVCVSLWKTRERKESFSLGNNLARVKASGHNSSSPCDVLRNSGASLNSSQRTLSLSLCCHGSAHSLCYCCSLGAYIRYITPEEDIKTHKVQRL